MSSAGGTGWKTKTSRKAAASAAAASAATATMPPPAPAPDPAILLAEDKKHLQLVLTRFFDIPDPAADATGFANHHQMRVEWVSRKILGTGSILKPLRVMRAIILTPPIFSDVLRFLCITKNIVSFTKNGHVMRPTGDV